MDDELRHAGDLADTPREFDGYRLDDLLGRGAVGSVYRARDTLLERDVAVKLLQDSARSGPAVERFLTEARALARLHHPNVVTVHRVGTVVGRPYIVYEWVRGQSLETLPHPCDEALLLRIALDLARGLEAAHARGVIHRDVKPANAILSREGPAKLVDFGLARIGPRTEPEPEAPARASPTNHEASPSLTATGALLGTPSYMAPETWDRGQTDERSDLYSLGALLYELAAGAPPHTAPTEDALAELVVSRGAQPLAWRAPALSPELGAVIDRCLERDPEARFASAEALVWALSSIAPRAREGAPERPYPALTAFRPEDRRVFFGRDQDVERVVDRLRREPLVVVAGDSGVGKSSLLGAGLAPRVAEDALGEDRRWAWVRMQPGRRPLATLLATLAPWIDQAAAPIEVDELEQAPELLVRRLRERLGARAGLVVIVDQLEELVSVAAADDARAAARALTRLADHVPGVRVVASARSDLLSRVAALPELGEAMAGAIHVLRPLEPRDLRQLIVQPALMFGVRFESAALVDELIASVGDRGSRLPLLEFALAELWALRDRIGGLIRAASLAQIGGVGGALARHADGVLAGLSAAQREGARAVLLCAVTASGTRRAFTASEVGADVGDVLEALVRGRLLLAHPGDEVTFELAHEALIGAWATLEEWLRADDGRRAARDRVARQAAEWLRAGRPDDGLLLERTVAELDALGLSERELDADAAALLAASRARARRRRWVRIGAGPLLLALGATIYGGFELAQSARRERALTRRLDEATAGREAWTSAQARAGEARAQAELELVRGSSLAEGRWSAVLAARAEARVARARESRALEGALSVEPRDHRVRAAMAELLHREVLAAEEEGRPAARDVAIERLAAYDDDGAWRARLEAPAQLELAISPAGTSAALRAIAREADGRRVAGPPRPLGVTPLSVAYAPGNYLLELSAPGRPPVVAPLMAARGEHLALRFAIPERVPEGYVFVPPGRFLFGSPEEGSCRTALLGTLPLHEAQTAAFLIARHEVTFGEWLDYLDALPPSEREQRTPRVDRERGGLSVRAGGGAWAIDLTPTDITLSARAGEPLVYPARASRARVDWRRLPVLGVSPEDALAYAAWLDRSGRVPHARLCREDEWERAARGADDRRYPHGDVLLPDDANHDATYQRAPGGFGPDEVGAHPASRSPFGVDDMAGNAWEWARSTLASEEWVARGGGWYEDASGALSANRAAAEATMRDPVIGVRLCADP